jgi:hypothetical protein
MLAPEYFAATAELFAKKGVKILPLTGGEEKSHAISQNKAQSSIQPVTG